MFVRSLPVKGQLPPTVQSPEESWLSQQTRFLTGNRPTINSEIVIDRGSEHSETGVLRRFFGGPSLYIALPGVPRLNEEARSRSSAQISSRCCVLCIRLALDDKRIWMLHSLHCNMLVEGLSLSLYGRLVKDGEGLRLNRFGMNWSESVQATRKLLHSEPENRISFRWD